MKLSIQIAALALLALMSAPTAAYADNHDNDKPRCEDRSNNDDDCDEGGRKKPKFQTKFFSE